MIHSVNYLAVTNIPWSHCDYFRYHVDEYDLSGYVTQIYHTLSRSLNEAGSGNYSSIPLRELFFTTFSYSSSRENGKTDRVQ